MKEYRIKDVAIQIGSGTTPSSNNEKYYTPEVHHWINTGDLNNGNVTCGKKLISDLALQEVPSLRFYPIDTVLIAMYGASIGKTGLLKVKATVNQACCALVPNTKLVSPQYLLYFMTDYKTNLIKESFGGTQPNVSQAIIANTIIKVPSLEVQNHIVSYLEEKNSAIDKRISTLEKKQDAYKRLKKSIINEAVTRGLNPKVALKDSGIEWIGMIPEHWNTCRMKDISYMYSGLTGKAGEDFRCEDESKTKPFVPFTNILNNSKVDPQQLNYVVIEENEEQNKVKKGDLLFLMSSEDYESIAKSAVVMDDLGETYLNSFCRGVRLTNNQVCPSFLNYELCASKNRDALRFEARGFTRINIKIDRIACHLAVIPPLDEQKAIANYLDDKCAKIDAAIINVSKQIDALKRLKRALINEVVTGKRSI